MARLRDAWNRRIDAQAAAADVRARRDAGSSRGRQSREVAQLVARGFSYEQALDRVDDQWDAKAHRWGKGGRR